MGKIYEGFALFAVVNRNDRVVAAFLSEFDARHYAEHPLTGNVRVVPVECTAIHLTEKAD